MSKKQPSCGTDKATGFGLILQRLSEQATKQPNKPAIYVDDNFITYSKLLERVDNFSLYLNEIGIGAESVIGIAMERSINMVIALFSIWKSGAIFVPLDTDLPQFRLNQIIEDAKPSLIISDKTQRHNVNSQNIKTIIIDQSNYNIDMIEPPLKIEPESIAYIMFTSGSTGRPKGVRVSHVALENFLMGFQIETQIKSKDTFLAVTSLSFDISLLEIVLPLIQGATLVLTQGNQSNDGNQIAMMLENYNCTFLQATPATWNLLIDTGWQGKKNLAAICGGENLQRTLAEKLLNLCSHVFNAYGPTEATIWALVDKVESDTGLVPIGKPLSNYQAYILDNDLKQVEPGNIGQLFLGGPSLAVDYFNRPQETCKYFISNHMYGRLYATGDLVRKRQDNKFEFIGREDHQVKIRGHRIELGDIQSQLVNLTDVKQAIVTTKEMDSNNVKLVAYVILENNIDLNIESLRSALMTKLPNYMIPHYFVQLSEFPLTHNKKIDFKKLPTPQIPNHTEKILLKDPIEAYLQKVWNKVLGVPNISATDDFFELGGDSIQAALITNRLQDWLGEMLWPVIIFDAPTIHQLAHYLKINYPQSIAKKTLITNPNSSFHTDRIIDEGLITEFNRVNCPMKLSSKPTKKNKQAIFLLCPPRSGSTLLRVMLAGNTNIFAPPEIEMLTFNTLKERAYTFQGRESYRLEGLIRAVMEIKGCTVDEAKSLLEDYQKTDISVHDFYAKIQHWLGNRILLDKTPANCLDLTALKRIEKSFENPLYIHLTRHPYGMIRSFLEARLSEVFFRRVEHSFSPRELAELIWYSCNNNIHSILKNVPSERKFNISFEHLLSSPEAKIKEICRFLNIEFISEMMEPHRNKQNKMTDGLHKVSKMMGDPKFHQHKNIDSSVANRWKLETPNIQLGHSTQNLAGLLGYEEFLNNRESEKREDFIL